VQTDWLNIIFTLVQIAGGLWTLVFGGKAILEVVQQRGQNHKQLGQKKPSFKLKPLTVANILLGLLVILVGTIAVKLSLQPQSTALSTVTVSVTPTTSPSRPGPLVRTPGVNGAYSLLHLFCDDIGSGQDQQAYNLMTETEQSFVGLSELKHWAKCTPPSSTSEITMLSQIQGSCVIQMFGTGDTAVRKITLSYTDQDGWKISAYRS
jgi:hypothetical protein